MFLAGLFLFTAMGFITPFSTKKSEEPCHGYWVAKSGEEFIIMSEAIIQEAAYVKDAKGELKSIDNDAVKTTLHFIDKPTVDGKVVDAHFFAFTKVELNRSIRAVSPTAKNVLPALNLKDLAAAYLFCTGGTAAGWGGTTSFASSSGLGTAIKWSTGETISIYTISK